MRREPVEDDPRLDAGLRAAFGPVLAVADAQRGLSALARLEGRLGADTRVYLRDEVSPAGTGGAASDAAPPAGIPGARYEPLGEIARGGMGVIIRSRDNDLGRDVAMKVLQPQHAGNRAMVQRFVEEAQIAGQLQHPGILQVYELGLQEDQRPYFTMKLIKGRTLAELLAERSGPADEPRRFLSIFERVCQAMAYTHARGVIHRDLKPANVMVGNFGEVQIVDWGLAKLLPQRGEAAEAPAAPEPSETEIRIPHGAEGSHSMAGSVMGTPAYMPPEQARGDVAELDERADVFALGGILCEILTGAAPYKGTAGDVLEDAKLGNLADAWARLDGCGADAELVELTRSCLAPKPRDRLRDARAVSDRISAYLASVAERARRAELAAVEARAKAAQERRARRLAVALAAVILLAFTIVGGTLIRAQGRRIRHLNEVAANSQAVSEQLEEAMQQMAVAAETPVSEQTPWIALRSAASQVAVLHGVVEVDQETRDRASAFLNQFTEADRDRRLIEAIEEHVIAGATHDDRESWVEMEAQLRGEFADYGIDLSAMPSDEVVSRIQASDFARQIADGLEMWVATSSRLVGEFGSGGHTIEELREWMEVVYEADPDPYRTAVRRMAWAPVPDPAEARSLAAAPETETAPARTLSWLAFVLGRVGEFEAADELYGRALQRYPTDFMLNADYALLQRWNGRLEEAIRYYHRALAIRPKNGGIWRQLGNALRETGDLKKALEALNQSITYQPEYGPTWLDLGAALDAGGDADGALEAYATAVRLAPDLSARADELRGRLQTNDVSARESPLRREPDDGDSDTRKGPK